MLPILSDSDDRKIYGINYNILDVNRRILGSTIIEKFKRILDTLNNLIGQIYDGIVVMNVKCNKNATLL